MKAGFAPCRSHSRLVKFRLAAWSCSFRRNIHQFGRRQRITGPDAMGGILVTAFIEVALVAETVGPSCTGYLTRTPIFAEA
jgi:hypothetical protein